MATELGVRLPLAGCSLDATGDRTLAKISGLEGIVSNRLGSPCRSGRSRDWLKMKNPAAPAVKREAEEDWGR
jgi:ATP-dependent DNA ligase